MRDPQEQGLLQPERLCRTDRRAYDGPSHMSVGGHLTKMGQWGVTAFGTDPTMVRRGYDGLSHVSVEGHLEKVRDPQE